MFGSRLAKKIQSIPNYANKISNVSLPFKEISFAGKKFSFYSFFDLRRAIHGNDESNETIVPWNVDFLYIGGHVSSKYFYLT